MSRSLSYGAAGDFAQGSNGCGAVHGVLLPPLGAPQSQHRDNAGAINGGASNGGSFAVAVAATGLPARYNVSYSDVTDNADNDDEDEVELDADAIHIGTALHYAQSQYGASSSRGSFSCTQHERSPAFASAPALASAPAPAYLQLHTQHDSKNTTAAYAGAFATYPPHTAEYKYRSLSVNYCWNATSSDASPLETAQSAASAALAHAHQSTTAAMSAHGHFAHLHPEQNTHACSDDSVHNHGYDASVPTQPSAEMVTFEADDTFAACEPNVTEKLTQQQLRRVCDKLGVSMTESETAAVFAALGKVCTCANVTRCVCSGGRLNFGEFWDFVTRCDAYEQSSASAAAA